MRKIVTTIAFIGVLVLSCSKKPDHSLQDSNVMLQEPDRAPVVDSIAVPATVDQGNENINVGSHTAKRPVTTDSTVTK